MKLLALCSALSLTTLTLAAILPAHAQFVSIPVTNGNFAITKIGGTVSYSTLPTFLSPAGTISITGVSNINNSIIQTGITVTTDTPIGFAVLPSYIGSASLKDGRTANFTGAGASLRGTATVTGVASITAGGTTSGFRILSTALPNGATLTYTVQSGALHIPASSLSAYSTPQFNIPISGGSFTLTDPTGTGNATVVVKSALTPLGTTDITLNLPNLSNTNVGLAAYSTPSLTVNLSGLANGTVALNDGRVAKVLDRFITLAANTQATGLPQTGWLHQGANLNTAPVTIQGTITGGSISVPVSDVAFPSKPVQPQQPQEIVTRLEPIRQELRPEPVRQEFAPRFAQSLNLGGDPGEYLKRMDLEEVPSQTEELPEVEVSPLAQSRIHPAVNAFELERQ